MSKRFGDTYLGQGLAWVLLALAFCILMYGCFPGDFHRAWSPPPDCEEPAP